MADPGTIDDLIDELEEWLEEADEILDNEPDDPIPGTTQDSVSTRLDGVEQHIDLILDPKQSPSLSPSDAGENDQSVTASNLEEYRQITLQLAKEAKAELASSSPDHNLVGSRLKTIKRLLDGYRDAVGIT